jgi:hypothetical protein
MWYQNGDAGSDFPPQSATEIRHFICSSDTCDAYCACFAVDRGDAMGIHRETCNMCGCMHSADAHFWFDR